MVIFLTLFAVANILVTNFFAFIYVNVEAIYTIVVLLIFAAIGMMFISQLRKYSVGCFLLTVLVLCGIEILAPYIGIVTIILSVVFSLIMTFIIKRRIVRYMRRRGVTSRILYLI